MELSEAIGCLSRSPEGLSAPEHRVWCVAYEQVFAELQQIARRLRGRFEEALLEDACSEVCVMLFRRGSAPEIQTSASGWLRSTLYRKAQDLEQQARGVPLEEVEHRAASQAPDPAEAAESCEEQEALREALGELAAEVDPSLLGGQKPEEVRRLMEARRLLHQAVVPTLAGALRSDAAEGLERGVRELIALRRGEVTMDAVCGIEGEELTKEARRKKHNAKHKGHERTRERLTQVVAAWGMLIKCKNDINIIKIDAKIDRDAARMYEVASELRAAHPAVDDRTLYLMGRYLEHSLRQRATPVR